MSTCAGPMMGSGRKRGGDEEVSNVKNVKVPGESYPGENEPNVKPAQLPNPENIKQVPEGGRRRRTIMRKGYVARRRGKTVRVSARRIRDIGAKGKWASLHGPGIGELKTGALQGYTPTKSKTARHGILRKVVKKAGPLKTFRRLQALSTYTKRTAPSKSRTAKADRNWVKKTFMKK